MFSDPEKNIEQFALSEGWQVADFGSGSGAYTLAMAKVVGTDGHVYAIDISQDLLTKLSNEARDQKLFAVEVMRGDLEKVGGTNLRDQSLDAAIAANIFFQIEDKKAFISEMGRVLKKGGKALIIDWMASFGGLGPHPDHIVDKDELQKLFEASGFVYEAAIDAGAQHYGLIFKKS